MSDFEETETGFPLTVGDLTFVREEEETRDTKKPRAIYRCKCDRECPRDRPSMRAAKRRALQSACKSCVRARNKQKHKEVLPRYGAVRRYGRGEIIDLGPVPRASND